MRLAILLGLLLLPLSSTLTLRSAAAPATSAFATLSRRLPLDHVLDRLNRRVGVGLRPARAAVLLEELQSVDFLLWCFGFVGE